MSETPLKKEKTEKLISLFRNIKNNNVIKRNCIIAVLLIIVSILSFYFISTNENYYNKTIAKITTIREEESQKEDFNGKSESVKNQQIKAIIMNGIHKGEEIQLQNTASYSQAYDCNLKVNDEVFVHIQEDVHNQITSSRILNVKRDKYIAYITILFILLILLIGGVKGWRSLNSVVSNILIFSATIALFLRGYNLILIASIASILFITLSISIVSGINKKTISAILSTIIGTLVSMLITLIVIHMTNSNGIHYEQMEFLTHQPESIFFVEILVGTLGAIIDIAISISSSINEIYDKDPNIERKILINSGMEIGKDIMGTMANTLAFAYISGSIPMVLLLLKNGLPVSYIISINISLEIIRALTGSIGIALSIPITLYTSVILLKNYKNWRSLKL